MSKKLEDARTGKSEDGASATDRSAIVEERVLADYQPARPRLVLVVPPDDMSRRSDDIHPQPLLNSPIISEPEDDDGGMSTDGEEHANSSAHSADRNQTKKDIKRRSWSGFLDTAKARAKATKRRGDGLVKAAKLFEERTGGNVFLKAKYQTAKKPYTFKYGVDFNMRVDESEGEAEEPLPQVVSPEAVKTAVEEGFIGALEKLEKLEKKPVSLPGSSSAQDLFASPSGPPSTIPRRRSAATVGCIICGHDGEVIEYAVMSSVGTWYCHLHVGQGRPIPVDLQDTHAEPVASSSKTAEKTKSADKQQAVGKGKAASKGPDKPKSSEQPQPSAEPKKRGRPPKGGR
ncbi:unnamed protein product [Orchesella dallaii]|uniref:Uncharacterized protein n=1 Tax=Orchesella dallaii TaxID=48710 RepID=A0ABP1R459_9HEXA